VRPHRSPSAVTKAGLAALCEATWRASQERKRWLRVGLARLRRFFQRELSAGEVLSAGLRWALAIVSTQSAYDSAVRQMADSMLHPLSEFPEEWSRMEAGSRETQGARGRRPSGKIVHYRDDGEIVVWKTVIE
jgi:hypothetical protein